MMNKSIYLLTGAAGFLGGNISRALVAKNEREQNIKIRALVLEGDPAAKTIPSEVEIVYGNLLDNKSMDDFFAVSGYDKVYVIHCASMVTVDPAPNPKVRMVNVVGTERIIEHCLKNQVDKLVYVSSTSAIPELPKGSKIAEVSRFDPDLVVGCYGKSKAEATQAVMDAVRDFDLNASIVFPSGICGPNDYAFGYYSSFIADYVNGDMPAGIAGSFNAVDARDLAEGIIACVHKGGKGEGYVMGNELVGIGDIFDMVSRITCCRRVKTILPIPVARALAFFMGLGGKITGKEPLLTSYALYNLDRNNDFDSGKAARELGYASRPFAESIFDSVVWLAREGKINVGGQVSFALNPER